MSCPPEIRTPLLELLYWTFLEVRTHCQDERYCFTLADHAHNIPHLIDDFTPALLFFYWETERPCFLKQLDALGREAKWAFQQQWSLIENEYRNLRQEYSPENSGG